MNESWRGLKHEFMPDEKKPKDNELDTTIDEWRAEMNSFGDDPGKTTKELAEKFNVSVRTMQRRIAALIDSGKCKEGRAVKNYRGIPKYTPVYQLTPKKKESKKCPRKAGK